MVVNIQQNFVDGSGCPDSSGCLCRLCKNVGHCAHYSERCKRTMLGTMPAPELVFPSLEGKLSVDDRQSADIAVNQQHREVPRYRDYHKAPCYLDGDVRAGYRRERRTTVLMLSFPNEVANEREVVMLAEWCCKLIGVWRASSLFSARQRLYDITTKITLSWQRLRAMTADKPFERRA